VSLRPQIALSRNALTKPFHRAGEVKLTRPCISVRIVITASFPADAALDIEKTDLSPGVRRMLAAGFGSEAPFDHGRRQLNCWRAFVTAKAVERTAESIGGAWLAANKPPVNRALKLDLPMNGESRFCSLCADDGTVYR